MFNAALLSLSDGQSYKNPQICEEKDLGKFGVPQIFEEWTACFFAEGKMVVCHHWKIKVIQLDKFQRGGKNSIHVNRLILDGDISYSPVTLIHPDNWVGMNIPHFFIKRGGIAGQMTFSTPEGTFITHDTNCTSIILPDNRKKGLTSGIIASTIIKKTSCRNITH